MISAKGSDWAEGEDGGHAGTRRLRNVEEFSRGPLRHEIVCGVDARLQ